MTPAPVRHVHRLLTQPATWRPGVFYALKGSCLKRRQRAVKIATHDGTQAKPNQPLLPQQAEAGTAKAHHEDGQANTRQEFCTAQTDIG